MRFRYCLEILFLFLFYSRQRTPGYHLYRSSLSTPNSWKGCLETSLWTQSPMPHSGTAATPDNASRNLSATAMLKQQKKQSPNAIAESYSTRNANPVQSSRTPTWTVDLNPNRQRKEMIQHNGTYRTILISSFHKNHLIELLRSSSDIHHMNKSSPLLSPAQGNPIITLLANC